MKKQSNPTPKQEFAALCAFVSKDITRSTLGHIHVEQKGNGQMSLVATDGHKIIVITLDDFAGWLNALDTPKSEQKAILERLEKEKNVLLNVKRKFCELASEEHYPYPKWKNVIPLEYSSEVEEMPFFSGEQLKIVQQHSEILADNHHPLAWNDYRGFTLFAVTYKYIIGLMPLNIYPRDKGTGARNTEKLVKAISL